jgi:predicted metal-binding protein
VRSSSSPNPGHKPYAGYLELALKRGAQEAVLVPTRRVVTAEWVRLKCQFGCSGYGKRLCCPPTTPVPGVTRRVLDEYRTGLLYTYSGADVDDYPRRRRMERVLADLERTICLDGFYKALALGAGPCRLCATCDTTRPCRHPCLARPAMEACGIDVYATCRNAGIELNVVRELDARQKYVNLILIE